VFQVGEEQFLVLLLVVQPDLDERGDGGEGAVVGRGK
jgi:hypothetical protein